MAMIQKRTMTFDSSHPDSSKWWWIGAIRKTRRPVSLKRADLEDDRQRLDHEEAADEDQQELLLDDHGEACRWRAPSASEPTSPMKTSAGWALNQRKPRRGADERAAEDRQLAGPRDVRDEQVVRHEGVTGDVGEDRVGRRGDERAADGEAVEPVGEVHGVRAPTMTRTTNGR